MLYNMVHPKISIRAPLAGSDVVAERDRATAAISIRAPLAGSDDTAYDEKE